LAFGVFEYFFLDTFLKIFGIAEYYIARGTLEDSEHALNVSKGLMVSGFRPEDQGRALLSFLGDHRVSSIFLEPITLGNFGTWVTLWAVVRSLMEGRLYIWSALGGLALLVLSDARFDAFFVVLGVVILITPPRITTLPIFLLPFLVIIALYILAASADPYDGRPMLEGRAIYDRLLYSGRVLSYLDAYNWFGLEAARADVMDAGYAYVISNVGIIGAAVLWILVMSLQGSSRYFFAFRNVAAVYLAASLCISASQFTIKIAALLWFLLGVLSAVRNTEPRGSARLQ
jgi:putative polymerase